MDTTREKMQRIFDEDTLDELKGLYGTFLPNGNRTYTKTALAERFGCSITTICLWLNPNEEAREQKFRSRITKTVCDCGNAYKGHSICSLCKIQTHSREEIKNLPQCYKYGKKTNHTSLCDLCYAEHGSKSMELVSSYKIGSDYREYIILVNPYTREISLKV